MERADRAERYRGNDVHRFRSFFERFHDSAKALSVAARIRIDRLNTKLVRALYLQPVPDESLTTQLDQLEEADTLCRHFDALVSRIVEREHNSRNVSQQELLQSEARSVLRLSVIASIFLPLSLAASILGMQTRLKDLQLRLLDYACVSFSITLLTLLCWKIYSILAFHWRKSKSVYVLHEAVEHIFLSYRYVILGGEVRLRIIGKTTMWSAIPVIIATCLSAAIQNVPFGIQVLAYSLLAAMAGNIVLLLVMHAFKLPRHRSYAKKVTRVCQSIMRLIGIQTTDTFERELEV